jgi:hypothetical protein
MCCSEGVVGAVSFAAPVETGAKEAKEAEVPPMALAGGIPGK